MKKFQILKLDQPTFETGLVYPSEVIEKAIEEVQQRTVWGVFGMPANLSRGVDLSQVSHRVKNLAIEDGWLVGEIHPVNTTFGILLQEELALSEPRIQFRLASYVDVATDRSRNEQTDKSARVVGRCHIVTVAAVDRPPAESKYVLE